MDCESSLSSTQPSDEIINEPNMLLLGCNDFTLPMSHWLII